jgi:DNA polymerase I-like protein with 3'-5' exonuclease and polymerase domains
VIIGLDTETTGVDLRHDNLPFFVTIAQDDGEQLWWEWDVNPVTRKPHIPLSDIYDIRDKIREADGYVLQNTKFDYTALHRASPLVLQFWDWSKLDDTLVSGHLLASNQRHDLTSMTLLYLGKDIKHYEDKLRDACLKARRIVRTKFPDWVLAKEGLPSMPSVKADKKKKEKGIESESPWKADSWLPRTLAIELKYPTDHPWMTVLRDYSNADSAATLYLRKVHQRHIEKLGLEGYYRERMKLIKVAFEMEDRGVTINKSRMYSMRDRYIHESAAAKEKCKRIAGTYGYELTLPKSGNNKSLTSFIFEAMKLPPVAYTDTGNPSLNKQAMDIYELTLRESSKQYQFIKAIRSSRKRDTAISFMNGYERFWFKVIDDWYRLHPNLNMTGTATLRWSCSNPNEQNISKQDDFNIRYCFGPARGREWWSLDAKNIELRLPAYEAGEQEMIRLFERPNDPPYFGSNHLLVCHILHPGKFERCLSCVRCTKEVWVSESHNKREDCCKCNGATSTIVDGRIFKERYKATWYQWVKNGNFAVQYGAVESSGTADRAYHVPGAQRMIQARFTNIAKLNRYCIDFANEHGYVETIPDKTIDSSRGYPLMCTRSEWGSIIPTIPLNYHVQGTAMWWMGKAMVRVSEYLDRINSCLSRPDYFLIMQVHDELVFDFPQGKGPKPWEMNAPKIRKIRNLMQQGGEDIGIPTPVSIEYHPESWSKGITFGSKT